MTDFDGYVGEGLNAPTEVVPPVVADEPIITETPTAEAPQTDPWLTAAVAALNTIPFAQPAASVANYMLANPEAT